MGYFPVRYDSRVVIYKRKWFIRLATGLQQAVWRPQQEVSRPKARFKPNLLRSLEWCNQDFWHWFADIKNWLQIFVARVIIKWSGKFVLMISSLHFGLYLYENECFVYIFNVLTAMHSVDNYNVGNQPSAPTISSQSYLVTSLPSCEL